MDIAEYDKIVLYLQDKKYVEGESENAKRRIRLQSKSFAVDDDGKLMYLLEKDGEMTQLFFFQKFLTS